MFVISNRPRKNILVNCDHGSMIINRFDSNFEEKGHGQWLLDHGHVSSLEAAATLKNLKIQDPVIFDIGANIGTYATILAKSLPSSAIYCFEPQRMIFQMLCGNFAINDYDNCYAYNLALGEQSTIVEITEPDYYAKNDFGTFSLINDRIADKSGRTYRVEVLTVDEFVAKFLIPRIDFIKIDAEGMDLMVLKGARQTLAKFSPGLLVEHTDLRQNYLNEIVDYLGETNYNFEVIHNNLLAIPK